MGRSLRGFDYAIVDGELLREKREQAGLSLRQLAADCGLQSHTYLVKLESGQRRTCSPELAMALSIVLRLKPVEKDRMFRFQEVVHPAA